MSAINVMGYAPEKLRYCPECGAVSFPHVTFADGRMKCFECGLVCYIVEAGDSHD